jgi:hypothetical protein
LIGGRAGGQSAHRSTIPDPAPSGGATHASLILHFRRWLKHAAQTLDGWFLPVAQALLVNRAPQPLRLAIDGRVVGRGCIALMGSVICNGPRILDRYDSEYHDVQEGGHDDDQPTELHTTIQDPGRA